MNAAGHSKTMQKLKAHRFHLDTKWFQYDLVQSEQSLKLFLSIM
jgi:hypothetical protein